MAAPCRVTLSVTASHGHRYICYVYHMKYLYQFLLIVGLSFAGELLHAVLGLPIPASIYGIVLFFLALCCRLIEVRHVREVSTFLIAIMPVLFIPSAVGLVDAWPLISGQLVPYVLITVVSTLVVMAAAGWATQLVLRKRKEGKA